MKVTSKMAYLAVAQAAALPMKVTPWTQASPRVQAEPNAVPETVDWDAQMQRHGRRVVVSLLARGIAPERAKELAQDAWLRVIQSHRRGRLSELRLPALVITQAQFLALDERRRCEHRYHYDSVDGAEGQGALPSPQQLEGQVDARQQLRRIQQVVDRSHVNVRRVFQMLYGGQGSSAAEIADELGISVQRVRQITCELRARIRREVGGSGG